MQGFTMAATRENWEAMKLSKPSSEEWDNEVDRIYDT